MFYIKKVTITTLNHPALWAPLLNLGGELLEVEQKSPPPFFKEENEFRKTEKRGGYFTFAMQCYF
ncbi:hypothetical protein MTsPCn5_17630 [Croceitalea sp. MTPC5]|nr:hypothetical protein MTsPCn5_17630 [Croceitalea sp. MTPC5]